MKIVALLLAIIALIQCRRVEANHMPFFQVPGLRFGLRTHNLATHATINDEGTHTSVEQTASHDQ